MHSSIWATTRYSIPPQQAREANAFTSVLLLSLPFFSYQMMLYNKRGTITDMEMVNVIEADNENWFSSNWEKKVVLLTMMEMKPFLSLFVVSTFSFKFVFGVVKKIYKRGICSIQKMLQKTRSNMSKIFTTYTFQKAINKDNKVMRKSLKTTKIVD